MVKETVALKGREFTKVEKSILLYLETCLVDRNGRCEAIRMNKEDFDAIDKLKEEGLIKFGRIPSSEIKKLQKVYRLQATHWVRFNDEAWSIAGKLRKERSERTIGHYVEKSNCFTEEMK